jgi:hypothetical protein
MKKGNTARINPRTRLVEMLGVSVYENVQCGRAPTFASRGTPYLTRRAVRALIAHGTELKMF